MSAYGRFWRISMGKFVKCPRCELNYIREDQQYCDICKAELGIGPELVFAVDSEKEVKTRLCPICKTNEIGENEDMCEKCRENLEFKDDQIDYDNDEGWKDFVNDDQEAEQAESEEEISLSKLAEEEAALDDDFNDDDIEDEEFANAGDDFEYVDPDDPSIEDIDDEEEVFDEE